MNEKLVLAGFLLYMIPAAVWDLKSRSVPLWYLLAGIPAGAGIALVTVLSGEAAWYAVPISLLPGIFLLLVCWGSEKKIGAADGLMFLTAGLFLGIRSAFLLLVLSLLLSSAVSVLLLLGRKASLRTRIPFLPFMAAALLLMTMQ